MASTKDIALLERKLKEAKTNKERRELKEKIAELTSKLSKEQKQTTLPEQRKKVRQLPDEDFNEFIARLKQQPEYSFLRGMSKKRILDDRRVVGKKPGWRIKGRGNYKVPSLKFRQQNPDLVYFENRVNRSDVRKPNRLEKGGKAGNVTDVQIMQGDDSKDPNLKGNWMFPANPNKNSMGVKMSKGGKTKAAIGEMVNIQDPKSLYNGKSGVIVDEVGNDWVVKTANGIGMVSKSKVMVIESMARGGFVGKGEMVWKNMEKHKRWDFLQQNFPKEITDATRYEITQRAWNFLPRKVKIAFEAKYANAENYANGGNLTESVTIEAYDANGSNQFAIYDKNGNLIEDGFNSKQDAMTWANENDYDTNAKHRNGGYAGHKYAEGGNTNNISNEMYQQLDKITDWKVIRKQNHPLRKDVAITLSQSGNYYRIVPVSNGKLVNRTATYYLDKNSAEKAFNETTRKYFAKGGKTKEQDPPIIRSYVDDEPFEYGDGGEITAADKKMSLKGQPKFKF
jgi:hypothetical protein